MNLLIVFLKMGSFWKKGANICFGLCSSLVINQTVMYKTNNSKFKTACQYNSILKFPFIIQLSKRHIFNKKGILTHMKISE